MPLADLAVDALATHPSSGWLNPTRPMSAPTLRRVPNDDHTRPLTPVPVPAPSRRRSLGRRVVIWAGGALAVFVLIGIIGSIFAPPRPQEPGAPAAAPTSEPVIATPSAPIESSADQPEPSRADTVAEQRAAQDADPAVQAAYAAELVQAGYGDAGTQDADDVASDGGAVCDLIVAGEPDALIADSASRRFNVDATTASAIVEVTRSWCGRWAAA